MNTLDLIKQIITAWQLGEFSDYDALVLIKLVLEGKLRELPSDEKVSKNYLNSCE